MPWAVASECKVPGLPARGKRTSGGSAARPVWEPQVYLGWPILAFDGSSRPEAWRGTLAVGTYRRHRAGPSASAQVAP